MDPAGLAAGHVLPVQPARAPHPAGVRGAHRHPGGRPAQGEEDMDRGGVGRTFRVSETTDMLYGYGCLDQSNRVLKCPKLFVLT